MTTCELCHGTGQVELLSQTEVKDEWLLELKKYCTEHKEDQNCKNWIPPGYVLNLINEIWQLTAVAIQYAREVKHGQTKSAME